MLRFATRLAASLLPFITLTALAESITVPGTKVSLEPPQGFTLSKQFTGFMREDVTASIVVTEMPAPVAEIKDAMTKENLAKKDMVLLESTPIQHGGKEALLVKASQRLNGMDFLKWMLITGEDNATTMVVGTCPKQVAEELSAPIQQAVLSASINTALAKDVFEGLLFRIEPSEKLKIAGRMGSVLLLTETGETRAAAVEAPLLVIGNSVSQSTIDDLPAFAQARAAKTAQVKDMRNFEGRPITLDGMAAYELLADATDGKSDLPMRLYQVIAPNGDHYFIAQGLVGASRGEEMLPEFKRVTESFKRQ
jgi:hypothetical protein